MNIKLTDEFYLHLVLCVFIALISTYIRLAVLSIGLDQFTGGVVFVVVFLAGLLMYVSFKRLIERLLTELCLRLGIKKSTQSDEEVPMISTREQEKEATPSFSYSEYRDKAIRERLNKESEQIDKAITYTQRTFTPYMSKNDLDILTSRVASFLRGEVDDTASPIKVKKLKTIDLMHYGWNIGNAFKIPQTKTANFLKQTFSSALIDVEVSTMKRKLKLEGACIIELVQDILT